MDKPISDMDRQLQSADRASVAIAILVNKGRRNACIFFGVIALALILFFAWNKWLLLIPAALGLGALLFQMNLAVLSSELKRRAQ